MCYFYPPVHSRSVRERTYVRVHGSPPVQCTLSSGKMSEPSSSYMLLDVAGLFNNHVKRSSTILYSIFWLIVPYQTAKYYKLYWNVNNIFGEQAQAATRSSFQEREKERKKKHLLQPLCGPLKTVVVFTYLHFVNGCVINPNVRYGNKSDF